jgi:cell cycle checkpoint protein
MQPSVEQKYCFECQADSTEVFTTILGTLQGEKDQAVRISCLPNGLKFSFEKGRRFAAKAYLKATYFQNYTINEDEGKVVFSVSLSTLLNCLQVFGTSSHIDMKYHGRGDPLLITLAEDGVITECELSTIEMEDEIDFSFRSTSVMSRAVVKSEYLKQVFSELEIFGATECEFTLSPEPSLSLAVIADNSEVRVDFPTDKQSGVFTEFECSEPMTIKYLLALLRPCVKAMSRADTTSLRSLILRVGFSFNELMQNLDALF